MFNTIAFYMPGVLYILAISAVILDVKINNPVFKILQHIFVLSGVLLNAAYLINAAVNWRIEYYPGWFYTVYTQAAALSAGVFTMVALIITTSSLRKKFIPVFSCVLAVFLSLAGIFTGKIVYSDAHIASVDKLRMYVIESGLAGADPLQNPAVAGNLFLYIHIALAVLGISFLILSFSSGIMYFMLEKQIKNKNFGKVFKSFPPLLTISKTGGGLLYAGFILYTSGLIVSAGWLRLNFNLFENGIKHTGFDIKIVLILLSWILFAVITFLRLKINLNAKQTVISSIVGFAGIIVIYAGVFNFIIK